MTKVRGEAEGAVYLGEPELSALFQAAPDPYLVLDKNLHVVAVNRAYLLVTMSAGEELQGRSVFELFPQSHGLPDAQGVGSLRNSLRRVLEQRTKDVIEVQKYQIRLPERSGGGLEERFWSTVNTPVLDADGEVAFIITRVEDVTEITRLKKQEESRREEEARLASYPILNPNPVIEFAADGSVLFSNPAAERLGRRLGQGEQSHPLLPPDLKMLMRELKGGMPCISREQEVKGYVFELSICLGSHGEALRIYAMDVTSRKNIEREREKLLLKLESVLESINEGVVISDLEGKLLTMNQEALRLHRLEGEKIKSRYDDYRELLELRSAQGTLLAPEQWPMARAMRGESFVDCELQVTNKKLGLSRFLSYSGAPVRERTSDRAILAVVTFRDITEAKRLEAELRIATAQLSTITEHLPIGVTRCDAARRYRWVSPEFSRWLGKPVDEISGRHMREVLGEDAYGTLSPFIEQVLTGQRVEFDLDVNYSGRGKRWVTGIYTPTRNLAGQVDGWVGVVYDVTERKQLEEQIRILNRSLEARVSELEEANQELAAFNHMVSHDLRRPLNTIGTSCQALEMLCGAVLNEECKEYLRIASSNVSNMSSLIEALLKFSRSTQGELRREPVDLGEMAREVIRDVAVTEPHRKVSFVIAEPLEVTGDPNLLQSVMENLIGNAWKYTHGREEAVIEIGSKESGGETAYFVRDNGPGFDMSCVDQLFLPFKRLPEAQSVRGYGIGLATVERIVRRHGGRVWAEGEPGKGATFYFTLPPQAV